MEVINVTPRLFYLRKTDTVPIVQEARWAPGPVWTNEENLASTGILSPDRPARSESVYRLSYLGPSNFLQLKYNSNGVRQFSGTTIL